MGWSEILGVIAVVISLAALTISRVQANRQAQLMHSSNYVPVLIELLSKFRSLEFNQNYDYVCTQLAIEHDPAMGISGLPDDARAKVYDVAYYYQVFATLIALNILHEGHIVAFCTTGLF
jgi:hypothetical protein